MVEETDTPETASEWLEVTWQVHCRAGRSSLPSPRVSAWRSFHPTGT